MCEPPRYLALALLQVPPLPVSKCLNKSGTNQRSTCKYDGRHGALIWQYGEARAVRSTHFGGVWGANGEDMVVKLTGVWV